jgi:hypothetical protein
MKKFGLLALVSAAFATLAGATACTGGSFSGIDVFSNGNTLQNAPATINCTATAPAGSYITGVRINTISDYSNPSSGATVTLGITNFTTNLAGVPILAPTQFTLSGTQVLSTTSGTNANQAVTSITVTFNSAFVSQSGTVDAATTNANGLIGTTGTAGSGCSGLGCSGAAYQSGIFISTAPLTAIPEPSMFLMLGTALIGVGSLGRKRRV